MQLKWNKRNITNYKINNSKLQYNNSSGLILQPIQRQPRRKYAFRFDYCSAIVERGLNAKSIHQLFRHSYDIFCWTCSLPHALFVRLKLSVTVTIFLFSGDVVFIVYLLAEWLLWFPKNCVKKNLLSMACRKRKSWRCEQTVIRITAA